MTACLMTDAVKYDKEDRIKNKEFLKKKYLRLFKD